MYDAPHLKIHSVTVERCIASEDVIKYAACFAEGTIKQIGRCIIWAVFCEMLEGFFIRINLRKHNSDRVSFYSSPTKHVYGYITRYASI